MKRLRFQSAVIFLLSMVYLLAPPLAAMAQSSVAKDAHSLSRYGSEFFAGKNAQTAYDMVNLLPGFTFSVGDTSLRGYAAAAGNVLIDGERISDKQFTLSTVLEHIPADQVDYLEVIEGGRPGVEMLGQTVVANVVRKKLAGNKAVLTLSNAIFGDGRNIPGGTMEITHHWRGGRTSSSAVSASKYVELAEGDGPAIESDARGNAVQRTAVTSAAGGLSSYAYSAFSLPAWKGNLAINGSIARTDYHYTETDATSFPGPSSSYLRERLGGPLGGQLQSELGAHFSRSLGERWTSESVALFDHTGQTYSSLLLFPGGDQRFFERERVGETLGRTNWRFTPREAVTVEMSAEGAYNWLKTSNTYDYDGFSVQLPNANATVSEARDQLAGNLIWTRTKTFQLQAGLQVENSLIQSVADTHQSKTLTYVKPRFALSFTPNSSDSFRVRVEHEVSQLNFSDFVASSSLSTGSIRSGNTDIVPQQDWALEGLYERHFWSEGDLVFTYRHFLLADVLDRVVLASPSQGTAPFDAAGNIGNGSQDTATVNFTAPLDRLGLRTAQLKATAVKQWSSVTDPTTSEMRPISAVHPLEYSLDLHQDLPALHANWGASFLTPCALLSTVKGCSESVFRFNEIDVYRALPTVNLFVETHVGKGWLVHVEGDNLLRQHFDRSIRTYAGPRDQNPLVKVDSRHLSSFDSFLFSVRKEF